MAWRIALLGAQDPLGEAVLDAIEESPLDIGVPVPLACEDSDTFVEYAGEDIPVVHAEGFDWSTVDALICVEMHASAASHIAAARAAGRPVIQAGWLSAGDTGGVVAVPSGIALAARLALAPLQRAVGLESLNLVAMLPVAMAGRGGVEELAHQTREVFAMQEPESEVFPVRMAFNLLPQIGAPGESGATLFEQRCADALRAELSAGDLPVLLTAVWAPVFHGAALDIQGRCEKPLDAQALRACWSGNPQVTVMDEAILGGVPTPFTDAQDSDGVFIGRLRVDPRDARRFALWLVCDAASLEAARIVASLENMIEKSSK